jgi:hypothetical protein
LAFELGGQRSAFGVDLTTGHLFPEEAHVLLPLLLAIPSVHRTGRIPSPSEQVLGHGAAPRTRRVGKSLEPSTRPRPSATLVALR